MHKDIHSLYSLKFFLIFFLGVLIFFQNQAFYVIYGRGVSHFLSRFFAILESILGDSDQIRVDSLDDF